MYTKAAQKKLERDVERANRNNFAFAAKLVRGAYMFSERKVSNLLKLNWVTYGTDIQPFWFLAC